MDRNPKLLYLSLFAFILIGTLNHLGIIFYLYWVYWWFDIIMHLLSGFSGGLIAYWVIFHSGVLFKISMNPVKSIFLVFLSVMAAGVAWEIMEYVYDIRTPGENYPIDTAIDLVLDAAGAFLAGVIGMRTRSRHG